MFSFAPSYFFFHGFLVRVRPQSIHADDIRGEFQATPDAVTLVRVHLKQGIAAIAVVCWDRRASESHGMSQLAFCNILPGGSTPGFHRFGIDIYYGNENRRTNGSV